ncbi:MAG: STAS domain-containing protein [Gammaproteobacteria bacterium]|nr:MAG: STAS domain-containing protein [Gammaproteobacteria bacterium]
MTEAVLHEAGDGVVVLGGVLDFASVPAIWEQLRERIAQESALTLSLGQVRQANSAALALLLEAVALARACSHRLTLENMPRNLLELAELSNVTFLLAVAPAD